jgi:hypothetical protein
VILVALAFSLGGLGALILSVFGACLKFFGHAPGWEWDQLVILFVAGLALRYLGRILAEGAS